MKIAQIAPLYEAVPPHKYGGTERIVASLTDGLVSLGHDVTLFASADSLTSAKLLPMREKALRLDPNTLKSDYASHLSMLHEVRRQADRFDILHFHVDLIHFPFFDRIAARTVTTLHGRLDLCDLPEAYRRWPTFPLVAISNSQRSYLRHANWIGTIPHGIPDIGFALPSRPREGYLAFLGRIAPEKGPDRAIAIAKKMARKLKIAAKIDPADRAYFHKVIEPMIDDQLIEFVGEIGEDQKSDFLGNASALLFPIDWPEPFGLVMIEAMACGTPVIAWANGSVPEVLDHGVTGFIVKSEEEAAFAISRLDQLDRNLIRREFKRRFSVGVMTQNYVRLYKGLLGATEEILQLPDVDALPDGVKLPLYNTVGLPRNRANGTRAVVVAGE
jgi:glycosyltransferase involved in cell wall biosynthesis